MMKKYFLLLLACLCGISAFAFDFASYPSIINDGDILLNTGVGFGKTFETKMQCPTIPLSMDYALPILSLPFTIGGIAAFSSEKDGDVSAQNLGIGLRLAYHFNWDVERLDTYALVTLGGVVRWVKTADVDTKGDFWMGVGIGGRYYFLPFFGAYLEAGIDRVQYVSLGITFKF